MDDSFLLQHAPEHQLKIGPIKLQSRLSHVFANYWNGKLLPLDEILTDELFSANEVPFQEKTKQNQCLESLCSRS